MFEDKTLVCKECGAEFVFTAGEQEFYDAKGFVNEPQRCKACRDARSLPPDLPERCSLPPALLAVKRQPSPLSPERIVPSTAVSAMQR